MDARRVRIAERGLRIAGIALMTAAIAGMTVLIFAAAAQGQTTASQPAGGGIELPVSLKAQLGTITGVIVLSLAIVELLKRLLAKVPYAQLVPVWCYAVAVANVLALLAKYALGTLPGDTIEVLWQASLGAATASGFYTWLRQPTTGPEAAAESKQTPQRSGGGWTGVLLAALAVGAASMAGCSQPPSQQYVIATRSYTGTLGALTTLGKAGMIPLADLERIEVVRGKAAAGLDRLKAAVVAGNPITAEWYLREVNALLDELIVYQIRAEQFREKQAAAAGGKEQSHHERIGDDRDGLGRDAPGDGGPGHRTAAAGRATRGDGRGDRAGRAGAGGDRERLAGDARRAAGGRADASPAGFVSEQIDLRRRLRLAEAEAEWD